MANWTTRIANTNITVKLPDNMYSPEGAVWQEKATAFITSENKINERGANPIGKLVTAINNCEKTVSEASQEFNIWIGYKAL